MTPILLLGFGTSHRRGQRGWTDRPRIRAVIDTCQPDATVDGASPSGGADDLVHEAAVEHFIARGLSPDLARRCPMDPAKDGHHGFKNRNGRMHRTYRPSLAAAFISGRCGSPMTAGSAHMLGICLAAGTPVVVYRDNGIEPAPDPLATMRRLYAATRDPALIIPGQAPASHCEIGEPPADEVLAALAYAREGSRWAPWIEAVEATVKKGA